MASVITNVLTDVGSSWSGFGFSRHTVLVCSVLFFHLCQSSIKLNMFASHWGAASGQSISSAVLRLSTDGVDDVFAWSIISITVSLLSGGISYVFFFLAHRGAQCDGSFVWFRFHWAARFRRYCSSCGWGRRRHLPVRQFGPRCHVGRMLGPLDLASAWFQTHTCPHPAPGVCP